MEEVVAGVRRTVYGGGSVGEGRGGKGGELRPGNSGSRAAESQPVANDATSWQRQDFTVEEYMRGGQNVEVVGGRMGGKMGG